MKNLSILILSAFLVSMYSLLPVEISSAQTEGFNVKSPIEKISDKSAEFLKNIIEESENDPEHAIPKDSICRAQCYLVIPSITVDPGRNDFSGTGLLGCRAADSGKLTPPLFYNITNLESFNESGGGLIILVTDRKGVKAILGDQLQINADNTSTGKTGPASDIKSLKSFVSYIGQSGEGIQGFDATGSTLIYGSGDTFKAYQQTVEPIDIMLFGMDIPPILRDFNVALEEWVKGGCK